jgi:DNA phosphorothioation-dependent restriction protein DptG
MESIHPLKSLSFNSDSVAIYPKESVELERGPTDLDKQRDSSPEREASRVLKTLNLAAFQRLHPELVEKLPNKFVALVNERVIDNDIDSRKLAIRVVKLHEPATILIRKVLVGPEEPNTVDMGGPEFLDGE